MSKSENQLATLYLADDDELVRKKVMKAKTDSGPTEPNSEMPDYIQNLFQLMSLVSEESVVNKFREDFDKAAIRYGDMKKQLAEDMVNFIRPIREKAEAIRADEQSLKNIIAEGTEKARASAQKTIEKARELTGLKYY
jgi:tryptophanyl-tRNA synthetase